MYFYFHVSFKDTDDIYIVRVELTTNPEREARRMIIEQLHGVTENNFEIKELTLQDLVSQFHFVDDIAQLSIIKNP